MSNPAAPLIVTVSLGGQEKRKNSKTRKSRSEEKVVGLKSDSIFPARKRDFLGTSGPDYSKGVGTRGVGGFKEIHQSYIHSRGGLEWGMTGEGGVDKPKR